MTDLTISVRYTKTGALGAGEPATGLTLTDIELFLIQQDRATGAETVIWDSDTVAVNPTAEMSKVGVYNRILTTADLDLYNYHASARYVGAASLDQDWVNGSVGLGNIPVGTALIKPYSVFLPDGITPVEGVKVEVHRNAAGTDIYWVGWTNALGEARDAYNNYPRLDPAPAWYFFRFKGGLDFPNPDIESVP